MADYRFYYLSAGRITNAEVHDCTDDGAARVKAKTVLDAAPSDCDAIEIWQLGRLVDSLRR